MVCASLCAWNWRNPDKFKEPTKGTAGLVVQYVHRDGLQHPVCREFESAEKARLAFGRLSRLKGLEESDDVEEAGEEEKLIERRRREVANSMLLYTRLHGKVWDCEAAVGSGVAFVELARWVQLPLRSREVLEGRVLKNREDEKEETVEHHGPLDWVLVTPGVARVLAVCLRLCFVCCARKPSLKVRSRSSVLSRVANVVLRAAWPALRVRINRWVNGQARGRVNEYLSTHEPAKQPIDWIWSLRLDAGAKPPQVCGAAVSWALADSSDAVDVDLDVQVPGHQVSLTVDANLARMRRAPDVTAVVNRVELRGKLRVKLKKDCVAVGFVDKPAFSLDTVIKPHAATGGFGDHLDPIKRALARLVEDVVDVMLVWPRCAKFGGDRSAVVSKHAEPIGKLDVKVFGCDDLHNGHGVLSADPYVVCHLGQTSWRTDTKWDTCQPEWPDPPNFTFDVHETAQHCTVLVYDSEPDTIFPDALLARATFHPGSLQTGRFKLALDTAVFDGKRWTWLPDTKAKVELEATFTPTNDDIIPSTSFLRRWLPRILLFALLSSTLLLAYPLLLVLLTAIVKTATAIIKLPSASSALFFVVLGVAFLA